MAAKLTSELSDNDVLFLTETVAPQLMSKVDLLKGDPTIIERMLDQEAGKLFQQIMHLGEERVLTRISPRFLFEVLLRMTLRGLENQSYTVERTASQKIPVFDSREVVQFLVNKSVLKYLADMLSSFTRVESYTLPVRVRKGVWRKIRFSDLDIDSLLRLCETVDEEHRFDFYKRIADLCLFILGMFPEYATPAFHFHRLGRSAEDFEEEGRRFYRLAGEHKNARILDLTEVFGQLHEKFNLAKKPLNYISEHLLQFKKQKLFPPLGAN